MRRTIVVLGIAVLVACGGEAGFTYEPARAELLRETVELVIRPSYHAVDDAAATLRDRATTLCAAPVAAGVDAARAAWLDLFRAWERTSAFQFGPTRELNLGPEIAFWPTRPDSIEENVAATVAIDEAWVESLGAAGLGIFALEYLLFAPTSSTDVAAAFTTTPRRCEYLVAVAADAERTAAEIVTAWDGAYGDGLATAGAAGNTTFPSQLRAISTLLTQILAAVTTVKAVRLGGPLGDMAGGVPAPDTVRSIYAGASDAGMLAEIDGVRAAWTAGVDGRGLGGYVATRNAGVADMALAQMTSTHAALAAIPNPLEEYVVMPAHDLATEAQLEARTLERTLGTDVAMALSISLMFTDADGD